MNSIKIETSLRGKKKTEIHKLYIRIVLKIMRHFHYPKQLLNIARSSFLTDAKLSALVIANKSMRPKSKTCFLKTNQ